jgi:hypothetical protein
MPRRSILSAAERNSLLETPTTQDNLIRRYAFDERTSPSSVNIVGQRIA